MAESADQPAVVFDHVSYRYPGAAAPALQDISICIPSAQRLGILGPNGGGKSTLLKLALGLLKPDTGRVQIFGTSPAHARAAGLIGYVPQKVEAEVGFPLTVRQVVTLGSSWRLGALRREPQSLRDRVQRTLELVGAGDIADRSIGALSGGQMQRVMIARALVAGPHDATGPRLLALDEPTVGIDALGQTQFAELLQRIHRELPVTIMIVSHDLRAIAAASDQVACLACRLHYHASPQGLTPQVLAELFSHDVAGIAGLAGINPALAGMHVHAHGPGEPCPDHGPAAPVGLTISGRTEPRP